MVWCVTSFSTVFQLHCCGHCTYPCFPGVLSHITIEITDSGERGMNPLATTIINPQKKYCPSWESNQRLLVLKSALLPTKLWGSAPLSFYLFRCRTQYLSPWCTGLENRKSLAQFPAPPIFFERMDDTHSERIHSSLTAVHCFDNGLHGKAASGLERIFCEVLVKRTPGKHG